MDNVQQQTSNVNVPPAGGRTDPVANAVADAMKPAVDSLKGAADRIAAAAGKPLGERGMDLAEFSLKGAVALGLATAGGYIARSIWRNRNAHLATS